MMKVKTKFKKVIAQSDENMRNQKKSTVVQDEDKTKKKKTNTTKEWKWEDKEKPILIMAQNPHISNGYRNECTSRNHCNESK